MSKPLIIGGGAAESLGRSTKKLMIRGSEIQSDFAQTPTWTVFNEETGPQKIISR
jgi:hypothetical protein